MRAGWELKKLGDVCDFQNGFAFQSKTYKESGLPILRITNIKNDEIDTKSLVYFDIKDYKMNLDRFRVFQGDLLIAMSGATTGKLGISNSSDIFYLNQRVGKFIPRKNVSKAFLYFFLTTKVEESLKIAAGAAQPNLSTEQINNFEIPLPPLPEQQRIVAILDECFAALEKAKANAEQNLKNAKELFESYLQGVFENKGDGWEEKTLAQISKTFGRGKSKHRPRNWEGLYGGEYPFIQTGDIRNCNHFVTEYSQTYNDVGLAQSKLWKSGTICITIAANIAETGILTFDACFPDSVIGIEVNEKYADRDFVEYLLQSFKVRIQALGKGSAQANINLGTFENELFPFPTVAEQKSIVEKLNQLSAESNKLETIYQQKLADLEELKKSILQKAFAGELTDKSIAS
jgi:type I restriction enzyme S subunit